MTTPSPASDVATIVWSWLADADGCEHAYHAARSADGISWSPACGIAGQLAPWQIRRLGARKVCVRCTERLTRG